MSATPTPVTFAQDDSTHALRNPLQEVIPPINKLMHKPKPLAEAEKSAIKEKHQALQDDMANFFDNQTKSVEELATKHNKKPEYLHRILTNAPQAKVPWAPSLHNALVYYKSKQLNEGRTPGNRVKLPEIQEEIRKDPSLRNLSRERRKQLIQDLVDHRKLKAIGACSSNCAATLDYNRTAEHIEKELVQLAQRTGCIGFCFLSCGHIHDSMQPVWFGSESALDFLIDVLDIPAGELSVKFELWSLSQGKRAKGNNLLDFQKDCAKLITAGLKKILNTDSIDMQYVRYDTDIRSQYKVELRGWPSRIPFASPYNIMTLFDIRLLRNALLSGDCHWIRMKQDDVEALTEMLKTVTVKPRVRHSDLGTKRGPHKSGGSKGTSAVSKGKAREAGKSNTKKKTASGVPAASQVPPLPKSKEFISDTEESDVDMSSSED